MRLDLQWQGDVSELLQPVGQRGRALVVLGEPLRVVLQRVEARGGEEARLPPAAAYTETTRLTGRRLGAPTRMVWLLPS